MHFKWVFLFSLLGGSLLLANIGTKGFKDYAHNRYFVETGTYLGTGIEKALKAKFKYIRSIEYDPALFETSKKRFKKKKHVTLYQGNSAKDLYAMIQDIKEQITFWLDAHRYPAKEDGNKNCPLLEELDQIAKHPIKTHTILIDDLHCCGTLAFDHLTEKDLIDKIKTINPDYVIEHVPGGDKNEYPKNVLVAYIPKKHKK